MNGGGDICTVTKRPRRGGRVMLIVLFLVALAIFLRNVGYITGSGSLATAAAAGRFLIYFGLFTAWGISLRRRIFRVQVRRYLVTIAVFMVFWMIARTLKYNVFKEPLADRICWYLYYVPILLIPMLALFAAMAMGKPEQYRTPKWLHLLWVPTVLLVLLVLTNDFHNLVFHFPPTQPWTDGDYSYGPGHMVATMWSLGSGVFAMGITLLRCRIPHSKKLMWLPIIPFFLIIVFIISYPMNIRWLHMIVGDIAVTLCLLIAAIFESSIQCGLIQSNTRYNELFRAATIAAQMTDEEYAVIYSAENALPVETDVLRAAVQKPVMISGNIRLSHAPIRGGHVFWQEDISALLTALEELSGTQEELHSYGSLQEEENKQKQRSKKLEEQKRLYSVVREKTAPSLRRISALSAELQAAVEENKARKILGELMVIGAYIKRRSNLVCQPGIMQGVPSAELLLCLNESVSNLRKCGVNCAVKLRYESDVESETAGTLYDFFEAAVELSLNTLKALTVFIDGGEEDCSLTLFLDCGEDMMPVLQRHPSASLTIENGAWCGRLSVAKGGALL